MFTRKTNYSFFNDFLLLGKYCFIGNLARSRTSFWGYELYSEYSEVLSRRFLRQTIAPCSTIPVLTFLVSCRELRQRKFLWSSEFSQKIFRILISAEELGNLQNCSKHDKKEFCKIQDFSGISNKLSTGNSLNCIFKSEILQDSVIFQQKTVKIEQNSAENVLVFVTNRHFCRFS